MNCGGRPKDIIWEHFMKVEVGGKLFARCNYCSHQQSIKACRMKTHYSKCSKAPKMNAADVQTESLIPMKPVKRPFEEETENQPPTKKVIIQQNMSSHIVKTSGTTKSNLDLLVAKFFYSCNIPFAVAEHHSFTELMQGLRPGYQPPTRKALSEHLLDKVTEELKAPMRQQLKDKTVTLVEIFDHSHFIKIIIIFCPLEFRPSKFE